LRKKSNLPHGMVGTDTDRLLEDGRVCGIVLRGKSTVKLGT